MSKNPYEPIRTQFGRGHTESAGEYTLYRRFSIMTEDEEVCDDTFVILRFRPDQVAEENLIPELQTAIIDDIELLNSIRYRDQENIAREHEGDGDSDYELESPFTQHEFKSVDTLYSLRTPQGQVFPLYEMQKTLDYEVSSEAIEIQVRKGLHSLVKPQPVMPELQMILGRT